MRPIRVVVIDRNDITRKGVESIIGDILHNLFYTLAICPLSAL
jgi:hypothetical protein